MTDDTQPAASPQTATRADLARAVFQGDLDQQIGQGVTAVRFLLLIAVVVALGWLPHRLWAEKPVHDYLVAHLGLALGLPLAVLVAFAVVSLFRTAEGPIQLSAPGGLTFKGASGPIVMWALCFLSVAGAIKLLA